MPAHCRLCLRNVPDMVPLFEAFIGRKLLVEIIQTTISVQLDTSLDLPRKVCSDCIKTVMDIYNFQQDLIKCQSLLSRWKRRDKLIFGEAKTSTSEQRIITSKEQNKDDESSDPLDLVKLEWGGTDDNSRSSDNQVQQELADTHKSTKNDEKQMERVEPPDPEAVEPIQHKCYICSTVLESKNDLNDHLGTHMNMLPYKCPRCSMAKNPFILSNVSYLNRHFMAHDSYHACPHCPLQYRADSGYLCESCGRIFNGTPVLRNHISSSNSLKRQRYNYEHGPKLFPLAKSHIRHKSSQMQNQLSAANYINRSDCILTTEI